MTRKIDNMPTINIAKSSISHGRNKHIETRFRYLQEQVVNKKLNLEYCRIENRIADIMTKIMQTQLFKSLRIMMNVNSLNTMG